MVETASVINKDGPGENAAFELIIAGSAPGVQALARAVRSLVYEVLPQTVEVVWPRQGSVGWGTGPKKFTEQFAYLMPFKAHVTLDFYRGGELSDPYGLLPDRGGRQVGGRLSIRSLKITSPEDVARPALRELIDESTRIGIPPPIHDQQRP